MKKIYTNSTDKTQNHDWNNFYVEDWNRFKKEYPQIRFVDVDESVEKYWKNDGDTVVFLINIRDIHPLKFVNDIHFIHADEYHYKQVNGNKYIVRLWWD